MTHGHPIGGWHVDDAVPTLQKRSTSAIILVYISGPTPDHGGKTSLVAGSHKQVAEYIMRGGKEGRPYMQRFAKAHSLANFSLRGNRTFGPPLNSGDVIIIHGLLAHSAGPNFSEIPRIAFTQRSEWRKDLNLEEISETARKEGVSALPPIQQV